MAIHLTKEDHQEICDFAIDHGNDDINEIIRLIQQQLLEKHGIAIVNDGWYIYEGFGTAYYILVLHLSLSQYFIVWGSRLPIGPAYSGRYESDIQGIVLKGSCSMSYEKTPTQILTCEVGDSYELKNMESDVYHCQNGDTWVCEFADGNITSTAYMGLIYAIPFVLETWDLKSIWKLIKMGYHRIFGGIEKMKKITLE